MFQFERPLARLMAHDFRPCDIGYTRIGVWVADFDQSADTTGAPGLTAAQRPDGPRRGASRVRAQSRRGVRRDHGGRPALGRWTRARADRHAPSPCARSRCRSPTSRGPKPSSPADSACRAPMPRCEALSTRRCGVWPARGRAAACSPPAASSSSSFSISIRSGGRARPATGSRIKASSTSPSALGAGAITASSTVAHARPGRGRTAGRFTCPAAGVVYVNDPDEFSVELLWMSPASDKRWGFTPRPARQAAEGRHARGRADGADRRARADHVGCDRRAREAWPSGSVSARCAGPSTAHRIRMVAGPSGC